MSALTRTLSVLGGRTARRTAILTTTPLLAAAGVVFVPAQAAVTWVGLEAADGAEGLPDTAATCAAPCHRDSTPMPAGIPNATVAQFTVFGTAVELKTNASGFVTAYGIGSPGDKAASVWLYPAAGTRVKPNSVPARGSIVKAIADRSANVASAPLALEKIRALDPRKVDRATLAVDHDFVSITKAPTDPQNAATWTVGTAPGPVINVDMKTAPAEVDLDVVAGQDALIQYTDNFVAD